MWNQQGFRMSQSAVWWPKTVRSSTNPWHAGCLRDEGVSMVSEHHLCSISSILQGMFASSWSKGAIWMKVYGDEQIVSEMTLDDLRQKKVVSVWNLAYADVRNPYLVMNLSKYYGWSSICEVKPLNSHARPHNSTQLALDGRLYQDKYLSDSRTTGPRVRVKKEYKLNSISRLVFWVEHQAHASDERRPSRPPSALRRGVGADFRNCLWLDFLIIIWN